MSVDLTKFFGPELRSMTVRDYVDACYATYTPPKRVVYPAAVRDEKPPVSGSAETPWKFAQLLIRQVPEAFVLVLPQAQVHGDNGAVIARERILLRDVSREFGNRQEHSLQLKKPNRHPAKRNATVAVLATAGGTTFYHWLFDIIPRIHLIRQAGLFDRTDFFLLPPLSAGYQRELLAAAGIDQAKIIEAGNSSFCLEARDLIVPSLPSQLGTINGWAADYLRSLFTKEEAAKDTAGKRIYLTRRNAGNRKMLQEDKLLPLLQQYGFEIVEPEKLTMTAQAGLFRNADVVMGPHGSGLSNLVFCRPGTKVIELFSSGFVVPCFWILANLNHLEYYCAFDNGGDDYPLQPYWHGKPADLEFSGEQIKHTLTLAGLRPKPIII